MIFNSVDQSRVIHISFNPLLYSGWYNLNSFLFLFTIANKELFKKYDYYFNNLINNLIYLTNLFN